MWDGNRDLLGGSNRNLPHTTKKKTVFGYRPLGSHGGGHPAYNWVSLEGHRFFSGELWPPITSWGVPLGGDRECS